MVFEPGDSRGGAEGTSSWLGGQGLQLLLLMWRRRRWWWRWRRLSQWLGCGQGRTWRRGGGGSGRHRATRRGRRKGNMKRGSVGHASPAFQGPGRALRWRGRGHGARRRQQMQGGHHARPRASSWVSLMRGARRMRRGVGMVVLYHRRGDGGDRIRMGCPSRTLLPGGGNYRG